MGNYSICLCIAFSCQSNLDFYIFFGFLEIVGSNNSITSPLYATTIFQNVSNLFHVDFADKFPEYLWNNLNFSDFLLCNSAYIKPGLNKFCVNSTFIAIFNFQLPTFSTFIIRQNYLKIFLKFSDSILRNLDFLTNFF